MQETRGISLVFREMWDTTALHQQLSIRQKMESSAVTLSNPK
jgi:hypothetical protein